MKQRLNQHDTTEYSRSVTVVLAASGGGLFFVYQTDSGDYHHCAERQPQGVALANEQIGDYHSRDRLQKLEYYQLCDWKDGEPSVPEEVGQTGGEGAEEEE